MTTTLTVTRCPDACIEPDIGRVITKPFLPGDAVVPSGGTRIEITLSRILAIPESDVEHALEVIHGDFDGRHRDLGAVFERQLEVVSQHASIPDGLSLARRRLIGAYFTHEYAIEAAALTNPSIVAAPDQQGLTAGETRFVMSLRAIGDGHVSCIEFRSGVVDIDMTVKLDPSSRYASTGTRSGADYDKALFLAQLVDHGAFNHVAEAVLRDLSPRFTLPDLEAALRDVDTTEFDPMIAADTIHLLRWFASSKYSLSFVDVEDISERVIFPNTPTESRGMEDVRLVRFVDDDGSVVYYGTYTAFDGHQILPQLIETADFMSFRVSTLGGPSARNKGIALFPRKIDGKFLALGRHDNVNNFLMTSTDVRLWHTAELIQEPKRPWELMQLGNCGSPLETDAGWLVITHGVGPMRRYSLGALLLDLDDPSRVIGHLKEPLLAPSSDEREGYVPNVVYSCGSMIHGDHLVLPYGFSDVGARVATVPIADLLNELLA